MSKFYTKQEAGNILRRAVAAGQVKKLPCKTCKSEKSEAHHSDYSYPLKVIWLCRKHHSEWHVKHGYPVAKEHPQPLEKHLLQKRKELISGLKRDGFSILQINQIFNV